MFNSKQEKLAQEELSKTNNSIAKGTTVEGNIETYGTIRIDGKVVGNIKTKSKFVTGPGSHVEGNVFAQNAEVEGRISGTLQVAEMLVLKAAAVVDGDISTDKLVVEAGAKFNGSVKMTGGLKEITIGERQNGQTKKLKAATPA